MQAILVWVEISIFEFTISTICCQTFIASASTSSSFAEIHNFECKPGQKETKGQYTLPKAHSIKDEGHAR